MSWVDIGTLGGTTSQANGLNDSGEVVGWSLLPDKAKHAFSWTSSGGMQDLSTFPGGGDASIAFAVNNAGVIVGSADVSGAQQAFRTGGPGGTLLDLGQFLPNAASSAAYAINGLNEVVGTYSTGAGGSFGFLYDGSTMIDLTTVVEQDSRYAGWVLNTATGINDLGQITGTVTISGQAHAYVLSTVPEPSPLLLAGLVLGAWLGYRCISHKGGRRRLAGGSHA
jgi:probable HAF family extracellular repeat protein